MLYHSASNMPSEYRLDYRIFDTIIMKTSRFILSFCILICSICALTFGQPASSAENELFTIKDIQVDVTADNSAIARQLAFEQAQVTAFERLVKRLLSEEESNLLETPDKNVISAIIRDYEITKERLSSIRYIGTYTFRFKSKQVKELLSDAGVVFTDVGSQPVLILPYFQYGYKTILWEPENSWMEGWQRITSYKDALVPIIVPIGDLEDAADMGSTDALTYDIDNLNRIVRRYKAGEAIIMMAIPSWRDYYQSDPDKTPDRLTIMMYRTDRKKPEFAESFSVMREAGQTKEEFIDIAIEEARKALRRDWKSRTMVDPLQNNKLTARIPFKSQKEWIETKDILDDVQGVNSMNILALSPKDAHIELLFNGSEQRLRLALQQARLILTAPKLDFDNLYTKRGSSNDPFSDSTSLLLYEIYLDKYR